MSERYVQAVFFWPADMATPFRAVYGRIERSNYYSKDFHQMAEEPAMAMERALGIPRRGQADITWVWPGGERADNSQFKPAAATDSRSRIHWPYGESPDPWRVTPNPTAQTIEVITGTPGIAGESMPQPHEPLAEAEHQKVQQDAEHPWYVAVHLYGDGPVLHVRTVLEDPKPGHEYASWDNLPYRVRESMRELRQRNAATGWVEFEERAWMYRDSLVTRILTAFEDNPNVLLVGPPGTGKTVAMELIRDLYTGTESNSATFDPDKLHGAFGSTRASIGSNSAVRSLVFHPSYAYEHFVMGLLPDVVNGAVAVSPRVGPLLELAQLALHDSDSMALLILDEFNRGYASAIFGDTLALLDRDKRDIAYIDTPYKHLNPKTDLDYLADTTTLPNNLLILAAMNSADRSVAPLDAALRRRFSIIHVDPDLKELRNHLRADTSGGFTLGDPTTWTEPSHVATVALSILESLNKRIRFVLGRDFLLGQSVFWNLDVNSDYDAALLSLAAAIDNHVLGTLALSFTDDDEGLAAVLGAKDDSRASAAAFWEPAPPELTRWPSRLHLNSFQAFNRPDLVNALLSLSDPVALAVAVTPESEKTLMHDSDGEAVDGVDADTDTDEA